MGSITSMLVLATIFASINSDLPKTAYFKIIDIWFNWFIGNIFAIIVLHATIDYVKNSEENINIVRTEINNVKISGNIFGEIDKGDKVVLVFTRPDGRALCVCVSFFHSWCRFPSLIYYPHMMRICLYER